MAVEQCEIERTDADVIAREHETAIAVIPDRARKRATEPLEAACAPAVVGVCNQLLVVPREEAMSFALECGAQFAAVGQLRLRDSADVLPLARYR